MNEPTNTDYDAALIILGETLAKMRKTGLPEKAIWSALHCEAERIEKALGVEWQET